MTHVESSWSRLAELPLVVESCEYDRLHAVLAHEFERVTTHVRLLGAGAEGLGEDVSVHVEDGSSLHETQAALPLAGEWTLAGFCDHLATLDPWPKPPEWEAARRFRNWAFESAALDLALRQAGRALHEVLGLEPRPVRFVNSLGLGKEPSIEPVRRRLARSPGVRFKLDAEATWAPALVDEVAATGAVDTIDFKGQYGFEVKDPQALGALYDHILTAFPDAYLEDPRSARSLRSSRCAGGSRARPGCASNSMRRRLGRRRSSTRSRRPGRSTRSTSRASTASRSRIRRRWGRCMTTYSPRFPTPTWRTRDRQGAFDRAGAPAARALARGALQTRCGGDLGAGARRRGRGDRGGRHDRLQGPVRLRGQGSAGAGGAV